LGDFRTVISDGNKLKGEVSLPLLFSFPYIYNYKKVNMKKDNFFFGWENIKWFIREIGKMYNGNKSHFSKKRVESGVAFLIGQIGMLFFLYQKHEVLTMSDFIMWATLEFAISGYIVNQIQKEKKDTTSEE
jgi:hypothetical protein